MLKKIFIGGILAFAFMASIPASAMTLEELYQQEENVGVMISDNSNLNATWDTYPGQDPLHPKEITMYVGDAYFVPNSNAWYIVTDGFFTFVNEDGRTKAKAIKTGEALIETLIPKTAGSSDAWHFTVIARILPSHAAPDSLPALEIESLSGGEEENILQLGSTMTVSGSGGIEVLSYDASILRLKQNGGVVSFTAIAPGRSLLRTKIGGFLSEEWVRVLPPEGYLDESGRAVVPTAEEIADFTTRVAELVNEERAKVGVRPLRVSADLMEAAAIRAEEISRYYSHTRPDGRSCYTAVRHQGRMTGENIAAGSRTPEDVIKSWMDSPGHRANILRRDYAEIGVGYFSKADSEYGTYWVQIFRLRNS